MIDVSTQEFGPSLTDCPLWSMYCLDKDHHCLIKKEKEKNIKLRSFPLVHEKLSKHSYNRPD